MLHSVFLVSAYKTIWQFILNTIESIWLYCFAELIYPHSVWHWEYSSLDSCLPSLFHMEYIHICNTLFGFPSFYFCTIFFSPNKYLSYKSTHRTFLLEQINHTNQQKSAEQSHFKGLGFLIIVFIFCMDSIDGFSFWSFPPHFYFSDC